MKERLTLRMEFPSKLDERQENLLIGHTQSLLEHLRDELLHSREKLQRTEFKAMRLAFGRQITDAVDSRLQAMTAVMENGKPFFYRYFHLCKESDTVYVLEYPNPQLLLGATGVDLMSKLGVMKMQFEDFYKATAKDMGFSVSEVRFKHQ